MANKFLLDQAVFPAKVLPSGVGPNVASALSSIAANLPAGPGIGIPSILSNAKVPNMQKPSDFVRGIEASLPSAAPRMAGVIPNVSLPQLPFNLLGNTSRDGFTGGAYRPITTGPAASEADPGTVLKSGYRSI